MFTHVPLIASSQAYRDLMQDAENDVLKHAYVFESADFDALGTLTAMFISKAEDGEVREEALQRMADGGYTDIVWLPRAEKNGKMDVEDVQYVNDTAYFTPTELSTKYYVIACKEPSAAVQNKLLKTLEEPPASARFILFSAGGDLLQTVLSRCRVVRLEEFSVETLTAELEKNGTDETDALFAAAAAHGRIGTAEKIAADPGYRAAFDSAVNFLLHVKRSPQILPAAAGMLAAKDKFGAVLDYFELILRDCMAYAACGAEAVVLKPALRDIITISQEYDTDTCLAVLPLFSRARDRLRLYGNAAGCIDEVLFSILEVKAKCRK